MVFSEKPTAIIWAKDASTGEYMSIGGITSGATTTENAVAQINKILGIVGKSITADGIQRLKTEEAVDNG